MSDDYYELVDDVAEATNATNETKHKFKVGDKVKVVNIDYISKFAGIIKVGHIGDIIHIYENDCLNPYQVRFDGFDVRNSWWFTDKCIELVNDNNTDTIENENSPIKSDGMVDKANETKHKFKVGKKVKSINYGRVDLTYNGVYDVFIDGEGDEFIIDDVGDKRYWSISDDDYYELVDDVVDNTNETKLKFKVGDKVKVVNTDYISAYDAGVRVGDIGTVIESGVDKYHVKFEGTSYDCDWFFTDNCIELVGDDNNTIENENNPIKSDGGSSSYYAQQIPKGMLERFNTTGVIEAKDVIRLFLGNDFNMGNFFKAYCRIISLRQGKGKAGIDEQYDLTKAKYFAEDELNYYLENKDV